MARYVIAGEHTLKCPLCGNKEFEEEFMEEFGAKMCLSSLGFGIDGNHKRDAWLYLCNRCGNLIFLRDKARLAERFI